MIKSLLFLLLFSISLFASIGKIATYDGDVLIIRKGKIFNAKVGFSLLKKDIINTKKHSKVKIFFKDATIITIGQNSKLDITEYLYSENSTKSKVKFKFLRGAFSVVTGKIGKIAKKRFKLETKTATIGIRGTTIIGNQEEVACTSGEIAVTSQNETVVVPAGMITQILDGHPPTTPIEYSTGQINAIDSGLGYNDTIFSHDSEQNMQVSSSDTHQSTSSSNARVENITIDSDVKDISNIASGTKNIAEQNIHSLDIKNAEVKNINIDGKAFDVNNIASGTRNEAEQNIGGIKVH